MNKWLDKLSVKYVEKRLIVVQHIVLKKLMKRQVKRQEVTTVPKKSMIKTSIRKVFGKKFYYYMIIF